MITSNENLRIFAKVLFFEKIKDKKKKMDKKKGTIESGSSSSDATAEDSDNTEVDELDGGIDMVQCVELL
jgi:hypothetical protein